MSKSKTQLPLINRTVLMSGTDYFSVKALNPYSDERRQPIKKDAAGELSAIGQALTDAGIKVLSCEAPPDCQDGVYTANWGLCRGDTVILSSLPKPRQPEETPARAILKGLGKRIIDPPYRFSGQGDALPLGRYLLAGSSYRTDPKMHPFIADQLGYEVISLQTIPIQDSTGAIVINPLTEWPDSYFYDIDLAVAILTPNLIAWCPQAFDSDSQAKIDALGGIEKIEVSYEEAVNGFACNLVSTGHTVIMSNHAPKLKAGIESHGLKVFTPNVTELAKGGGYIRCTTLTLDND